MVHAPADTPALSNPLQWFPEFLQIGQQRLRPQVRLLGLSLLVGVIAGGGAIVFYTACQVVFHYGLSVGAGYEPLHPAGEQHLFAEVGGGLRPWMLLVVPALGGLASGLLVYTLAPEAEGHGTDSVIAAYHYHQGLIRPRVPLIKIIASAITLGTGGSGGREGPIAQIGAGFGSVLGTVLKLRPVERRVLLAAGMGAGVAAIFRAPLAGALFASEVLYRSPDFESEVILPAGLASVTAYCTFGACFGWTPLFEIPGRIGFEDPFHLVSYFLLAVAMAVLAMLYTRTFYYATYLFRRIPIRPHFKPMIGAFLTGVVGLVLYFAFLRDEQVLSVLSFGYGILQDAMTVTGQREGSLYFAGLLLAVALGKIVTTSLTIGSGGSGGVFGPSMVIGGCGGGALGIVLHQVPGDIVPHPVGFVIVGMAGFFAAAAKTPFSTLVMVSEITGNYSLILPALWVCTLAFLLSDAQSIYSSQVENRSRSPAHQGDYVREVLTGVLVGQLVGAQPKAPRLQPGDSLPNVLSALADGTWPALPVTDAEERFLGMVSLAEVLLASQSPHLAALVKAVDLMRSDVEPLRAGDRLDRAMELFAESELLVLPVVDNSPDRRVLGLVRRTDVATTYLRHVHGLADGS